MYFSRFQENLPPFILPTRQSVNNEHWTLWSHLSPHILSWAGVSSIIVMRRKPKWKRGSSYWSDIKVKTLVLQNLAYGLSQHCAALTKVLGQVQDAEFPLKWIISSGERGGSKIRRWEVAGVPTRMGGASAASLPGRIKVSHHETPPPLLDCDASDC